jgi:citrate/tricarballylate utilization protein
MEMRRVFTDGDLNYLANLCHDCGACYDDCQFSPPHEFNVDVPGTFARIRAKTYEDYTWPANLTGLFRHNGLKLGLLGAASVLLVMVGLVATNGGAAMLGTHRGEGAFYALMPHPAMVAIFGTAFLYALFALALSARNFRRDKGSLSPKPIAMGSLHRAAADAATLRNLDGGGVGCAKDGEASDRRALFHHVTFYGFLLCFAATAVATLEHFLLGREAPYPWYEPPVVLGVAGGLGLLIGPAGLLTAKLGRNPAIASEARFGMDIAFIASLFLTSLTGLALLVFRGTGAMGPLLALHLGIVLALFLSLPYGKFVHGLYRYLALARYAQERRNEAGHSRET